MTFGSVDMLTITGEVRKLLDSSYKDKGTGQSVQQYTLVLEPANQPQNFEIKLTADQCRKGLDQRWQKLIGKQAGIEVSLYINFEYRFSKFTAVTGEPLEARS